MALQKIKKQSIFNTSKQKSSLLQSISQHKASYIMLAPWLILFIIFTVIPVLANFVLSFTYFNGLSFPKFIGLDNYLNLFTKNDLFYVALKNSFVYAIYTGPVAYIACIIFAWFINELPPVPRSIVTMIFYMPALSGQMFMIWALIFSGDMHGYLNGLLMNIGLITEPIQWLTDKRYMMKIVIIIQLWMSLGTGFLANIAGLQGIDKTYYEAAAVDGIKNRFQELWFITLPLMRPILVLGAVLQVTAALGSSVVVTSLIGNTGGTDYEVYTIPSFMSDYGGARMELGYVAAIAIILSILMISLNKIIQRGLSKIGK